MGLKDLFQKAASFIRGRTIADVSMEELERERNALNLQRDKLQDEADAIGQKERQLLEEGRAAANEALKHRIAAKIRDGRNRAKTLKQRLDMVAQRLKIVTGLHTVKENEGFYREAGLGDSLAGIPLANIIDYIAKAPAGVEATVDGMQDLLESLGEYNGAMEKAAGGASADSELNDILSEFDSEPPEAAPRDADFDPDFAASAPEAAPAKPKKQEDK